MNTVLDKLIKDKIVTVYMDDLIIASSTEEENLEKLKNMFAVAQECGMLIRLEKC